jgi:NAD(P)H dehydrogenase (quinone)
MTRPTVLVTGATGKTGGAVTRHLLQQGWPVRAAVRRLDARAEALRAAGAEVVVADVFDPTSMAEALRGVSRAYAVQPWTPHITDSAAAFVAAAAASDLEAVVWMTQWLSNHDSPSWSTRQADLADRLFAGLRGPAKIVVNPGWFADNSLRVIDYAAHLGVFPSAIGDALNAPPSNEDIARVVVAGLTDPARHDGRTYRPTGPELLDAREMAAIVGDVLQRRVRKLELPLWMFLRAARLDGASATELLNFPTYVAELKAGTFALGAPNDDVLEATGSPAEPFAVTAARYADALAARRTTRSRLQTLATFARVGFTPTPTERRLAKVSTLPRTPNARLAIDSPIWRQSHLSVGPQPSQQVVPTSHTA